jgi:hypothetical protein
MSHAAFWWAVDYEWRCLAMLARRACGPHTARFLVMDSSVPS